MITGVALKVPSRRLIATRPPCASATNPGTALAAVAIWPATPSGVGVAPTVMLTVPKAVRLASVPSSMDTMSPAAGVVTASSLVVATLASVASKGWPVRATIVSWLPVARARKLGDALSCAARSVAMSDGVASVAAL